MKWTPSRLHHPFIVHSTYSYAHTCDPRYAFDDSLICFVIVLAYNRDFLEHEETVVEHLEQKLEKTIKLCAAAVDSGKEYIKNQR